MRCVVFAAGKSSRMGTGRSKHIEPVEQHGETKPMLAYTLDLLAMLEADITVLIGYDGTAVADLIAQRDDRERINCLRVSKDDGSDLESNTGGTLKKYSGQIAAGLAADDDIMLCVGDQPFMQLETIRRFVERHNDSDSGASILLTDVANTPMAQATSTRVSVVGSEQMFFDTPPKGGPFEGYSTLVDVGVIIMKREAFLAAAQSVSSSDVFSKLLCHLPKGCNRINCVQAVNPFQFQNVNEKDARVLDVPEPLFPPRDRPGTETFVDRSAILLRWLEWNVLGNRRGEFDIFSFPATYRPEFEMDTTLFCRGTPACRDDCTYRQKRRKAFINLDVAKYAVRRAKALGFAAVLFSGGGENLEEEAYEGFLSVLKTAKEAGLQANLATNGLNLNPTKIQELIFLLDSIRFSIPPNRDTYSHLGKIAPYVNLARILIREQDLGTKLYANFLMTPETPVLELKTDILMVSQLGFDGIRFKGQHEWINGRFVLRPQAYASHIKAVRTLQQHSGIALPPITISKLERMMEEEVGVQPFKSCWYRDFNPLIVGCDSHNYACCEMKYEQTFDYGQIRPGDDNLRALTQAKDKPQPVCAQKCFRGCKGYLVNIDLQRLLDVYAAKGNTLFDGKENADIRERVLRDLVRSVLTN